MSGTVAATVVVTSAAPVSAETYFFRYNPAKTIKWNPIENPEAPIPDYLIGVGNDITIFFTGLIGHPFSKVIPVKTRDVVEWRLASGLLQKGLVLDPSAGTVSGTPTGDTKPKVAVLLGYDAGGTVIARASITSRFHDPVGLATDFTFYGHTNKYMFREIPTSVPIYSWESITDLPEDFRTEGRYLAGTPSKELNTGVGFVGYDYMGKEVAFTYGDLIVQDTPMVAHIEDQVRHPSKSFSVTPSVEHKIGELKWRLKALDGKPSSLGFNERTGRLSGSIRTFNTSMRFQIEAMDVDGTVGTSNVFKLTTSSPDVDLANMKDQSGTVGNPYSLTLTGKDLSGDMNWTVASGALPAGLSLDPETGEISGTPTTVGTSEGIVIAVTTSDGGAGQTPSFNFTIFPQEVEVSFNPVDVRVGQSFTTTGPVFGTGVEEPYAFQIAEGAEVSDDLLVDLENAVVSGGSDEAGDYSVPFNFINGDGREKIAIQSINVHENLSLAYDEKVTVYRRTPATVSPSAVVGVIGQGAFELSGGTLPEGLSISPDSGDIVGTPAAVESSTDIEVTVTDESGSSASSNSFELEVLDRPDVEITVGDIEVERFVDNLVPSATATNAFDGVTYALVEGELPAGLMFGEDGIIRGNTQELAGVYDGFKIEATDGEGYRVLSPVFSITLTEPKNLVPLNDQNSDVSATWVEGTPFSFDLPRPANAYGSIAYELMSLPDGVSVIDGKLVGTINEIGAYTFPMTLVDDARRTLSGTFTLNIIEPMSAVLDGRGKRGDEETNDVGFDLPRGGDTVISADISNAIGEVSYSFTGTLPAGLTYADGKIIGKPLTENETGSFALTLTDEAGSVVTLNASIVVGERVSVSVSYSPANPVGVVGLTMMPLNPVVQDAIGAVSFKLQGELPAGILFDETTGAFYGKPEVAGWSNGLTVTATDTDGGATYAGSYGPFVVVVGIPGNPSMNATNVFTVRAGEAFSKSLTPTNVVAPLTFDTFAAGLPFGLALDASSGAISGSFAEPGKYDAGYVRVTDSIGREAITSVKFVAVGPLALAEPTVVEFNQYAPVSTQPIATNVIGTTAYEIVSGSLPSGLTMNPGTGMISGNALVKGVFPIALKVTDSTGSTANAQFNLTVTDRLPLTMNTQAAYAVTANKAYGLTLPVLNAFGAKTFDFAGDLPAGIVFDDKTGKFTGRATVIGTFPVTVSVTDSVGANVTKSFSFVVDTDGKPINLYVTDYVTKLGNPITTRVPTYSNHVGDVQYWADATLADYGLSIDPTTGVISGTATELLDITPNIHITDASQRVTSKPLSIKVVPDLRINVPARLDLPVNKRIMPYIYVSADFATGPLEWEYEGTLPRGVNFSTKTLRFTGTPREMGTFPIRITAREKDGFYQVASADVEIAVVTDGINPEVSLKPASDGYYVSNNLNLYPKITNGKGADVVTLAPDSAPLPPGFTITTTSSGTPVLYHPAGSAEDVGVYEGIKLRVTSPDGLYGESEPFTIILKSNYSYPSVSITTKTFEPLSIPAPVPVNGRPVGTPAFMFYSGSSVGTLSVDPATGLVTGHVTKNGSVNIRVDDVHNGKVIRRVYYSINFKATPVVVTTTPTSQVAFTGVPYPATYVTTVKDGREGAVLTAGGLLPAGLTMDPVTGAVTGSPTTAGTYSTSVVYTDQHQTISTPFTIRVEQSAPEGQGYKYIRVAAEGRADHLNSLSIKSESGYDIMHLVTKSDGNLSGAVYGQLVGKHTMDEFRSGMYQDFRLPTSMAKGSILVKGHQYATVVYYGSVDGNTWVEIGRGVSDITRPFEFKTEPDSLFEFNSNTLPVATEFSSYSYSLRNLVDTSTLNGLGITNITWSWKVDPDRDPATTASTLPPGITLSGYTLSGTPNAPGRYALVVTGTNGGRSASKSLILEVAAREGDFYKQVAVGYSHACGVTLSGGVKCWGNNSTGQLGNNSTTSSRSPTSVYGLSSGVKAVAAGNNSTCALMESGGVKCWGLNDQGQLGNNSTANSSVPVNVVDLDTGVVSIAASKGQSNGHNCALMADGTAKCWGRNYAGQLGNGTKTNALTPVDVTLVSGIKQISLGSVHTCVVTNDGAAKCWGEGSYGRLGGGNTTSSHLTAVDVVGLSSGVQSIEAGYSHTCATMTSGAAKCWGRGSYGAVGNGSTTDNISTPVTPTGLSSGVVDVQVGHGSGYEASCALLTTGGVKCWGWDAYGLMGVVSSGKAVTKPTDVAGLSSGVVQLASSYNFACALMDDDVVKCWGSSSYIGRSNTTNAHVPTRID